MLNRRQFNLLALGTGAASAMLAAGANGDRPGPQTATPTDEHSATHLNAVSRKAKALGSEVCIDIRHDDIPQAERAITAAFEELKMIEKVMSLYVADSEICRLNREGILHNPHPYLVQVLRCAAAMSEASSGAFDITVQPLWEVYAAAKKSQQRPDPAAVEEARAKVDWRRVEILPTAIQLHGRGTAITLNGIAQGFAADRVIDVLRRHNVAHALVNTGEIAALGTKTDNEPWKVGVQHPRRQDAYVALVPLADRCLATSGDYATRLSDDLRDHHIFDPHLGRSPATFASVSVVAQTACEADALATTVFVLGPEQGLALVRSRPACEALLVFKDGRVLTTDRFPAVDS